MSHIVSMQKVNQFLPIHKLALDTSISQGQPYPVDHYKIVDLEETARDVVLAKLSYHLDTSSWFQSNGSGGIVLPPDFIINIMGMLISGWVYDRQFAEESTEGATYGKHKEAEAYRLLDGILSGKYKVDTPYIDDPDRLPSAYETDPIHEMDMRF